MPYAWCSSSQAAYKRFPVPSTQKQLMTFFKKKLYFNRGEGGNLAFYGDKTRYKPLPPLLGKGKQKTLENMGKILNGIWVTGT